MNYDDSSLCTFYGSLWLFLLESYTPGQVSTRMFNTVHTIACLSMLWGIAGCTPLYHVMAPSIYRIQYEVCTSMYMFVQVCTGTYWNNEYH